MYKTLCRFKTMCMHKDRNKNTHYFRQMYKAVHMPDSV